jgi:sulfite dehydrogenase (cytochrome) subunit B
MRTLAIALLAALVAAPAAAQEKPVTLKKGAGLDVVEANCGACHSLDYIQMNSPFLTSAQWDASIAKMINVFGAPISEADARAIGDYLKANYGADHVTENR